MPFPNRSCLFMWLGIPQVMVCVMCFMDFVVFVGPNQDILVMAMFKSRSCNFVDKGLIKAASGTEQIFSILDIYPSMFAVCVGVGVDSDLFVSWEWVAQGAASRARPEVIKTKWCYKNVSGICFMWVVVLSMSCSCGWIKVLTIWSWKNPKKVVWGLCCACTGTLGKRNANRLSASGPDVCNVWSHGSKNQSLTKQLFANILWKQKSVLNKTVVC